MKRKILTKILAILFGFLVFWGIAEISCRFVYRYVVAYDVEMWRYARMMKVSGITPGLRFEHRPDSRARLMGVDVEINGDGLRNRETPKSKPANTYRVAVVGDSVAFGWGVPQDQVFPRRLEHLLNQSGPSGENLVYEVLNFGVGNYNAADVANMLDHKALSYSPDVVVYGAFLNDAEPSKALGESSLVLRHSLVAVVVWGRVDSLLRRLGLLEDYREYYRGLYLEGKDGRQRIRESLTRMAASCRRGNARLVVALLPELHDQDGRLFADVRQFYRELCKELGLNFIDLQVSLPENQWQNYWVSPDDAHPNARACDRYARIIMEQLPRP